MKNAKVLNLLLLALAAAAVFAYWDKIKLAFFQAKGKIQAQKEGETKELTAQDGTKTVVATATQALLRPKPKGIFNPLEELKKGMYDNPTVWELQKMMLEVHKKQLVVDGDFGPETERLLQEITGGKKTITLNAFVSSYSQKTGK